VEYGDEWLPWFPDLTIDLDLEEDLRELERQMSRGIRHGADLARRCSVLAVLERSPLGGRPYRAQLTTV